MTTSKIGLHDLEENFKLLLNKLEETQSHIKTYNNLDQIGLSNDDMSSTDFLANIKAINTALGDEDSILYLTTTNADNLHLSAIDKLNTDTGKQLGYVINQNGKMVAVSAQGKKVSYSDDGINWTEATMPIEADWQSIAYGNSNFVVVGYYYDADYNKFSAAAYSDDGINWTEATMPINTRWNAVTYGDDKFIAASDDGGAYSYDGIYWYEADGGGRTIAYGNEKFISIPYRNGTGEIYYSYDGLNWTSVMGTILGYECSWKMLVYGNGNFIASSGWGISHSEDGINWTSAGGGFDYILSAVFGNNKFVAVGDGIAYSEDGFNWTVATLPISATWNSVVYNNDKFIAFGNYNNDNGNQTSVIAYSKNGVNWTYETSSTPIEWTNIIYGGQQVVTTTPNDVPLSLKISRTGNNHNTITIDLIYNSGVEATYIYSCVYNKETDEADDILSKFVITTHPKGFVSKYGDNIIGKLKVNGGLVATEYDINKIKSYLDYLEYRIPTITAGATDLEAGVSALPEGHIYLVLEQE